MDNIFEIIVVIITVLWISSVSTVYLLKNKFISELLSLLGILILTSYMVFLWINLERPPMRTLGETRLWYSLFISIIGYFIYKRWHYKWFYSYCLLFSLLFLFLNFFNPEVFSKSLMPALQSPWFVPHVVVYMISYAFLASSSIVAIKALYDIYMKKYNEKSMELTDNIVYIGFAFLNLGIVFGALWAKEAWGLYWTWDPKETWALITWLIYLFYIHFRLNFPTKRKIHFYILSLAFVILLLCWFGISYLPTAQNSVHLYS